MKENEPPPPAPPKDAPLLERLRGRVAYLRARLDPELVGQSWYVQDAEEVLRQETEFAQGIAREIAKLEGEKKSWGH